MKNILFGLFLLVGLTLKGQHTISGTFSPSKDYKWLIAYRLKPGTQNFVAETAVKNGVFSLKIPLNSLPGTYRLVYAVPQEEFYFDVIYNGKEDISLAFDAANGVSYLTSKENILTNTYFSEINELEQQIVDFYTNGKSDKNELKIIADKVQKTQKAYEDRTQGMIANNFISANKPFIPEQNETVYEYIKGKKENYFNSIELDNPVLQSSGFLTDKLTNYVFTALPLEPMSEKETENAIKENVNTVNTKMTGVSEKYKLHLFYSLWSQAAASNRNEVSDYIYNTYLKALAKSLKNQNIIDNIEVHNRLRIGAIAPDIQWKKGTTTNRLKSLTGAENYVLVFWSSTCGHCLNELPALHKELLTNDQVKVIAVGLEDNEINWKREAAKMDHFEHAIALGKWQSDYAKLYAVLKTPTYFVLDKDKHIIAKPEDDKAVVEFLTNN